MHCHTHQQRQRMRSDIVRRDRMPRGISQIWIALNFQQCLSKCSVGLVNSDQLRSVWEGRESAILKFVPSLGA